MFWNKGWYAKQLDDNIKALAGGDRSKISWIFCVFAENHASSKLAASRALCDFLKKLEFDDIIRIDEQIRQTTSVEWNIDWRKLKLDSFITSDMSIAERRAVIIFASFNPNGFIREQAVHMMSDYDGTLAYIILRQNDWVLQVREAAVNAFNKRLQILAKGEILAALPFAEKLKWSCRGSHGEYTQKFLDKLVSPEYREEMTEGLNNKNIRTRRICVNALLNASPPDIDRAIIQLQRDPDPFLKAMIFRKLYQMGQDMNESCRILIQDKFPLNRILALQYLFEVRSRDVLGFATKCLMDRNAAVRDLARRIVINFTPDFDMRTFYMNNLGGYISSAIYGLGEIGHICDTVIIENYLLDSRVAVVRAALVALMRLDSRKYCDLLIEFLADNRAGVVKTVQKLLLKHGVTNYKRVREIFFSTTFENSKLKCLSVLLTASKWDRLEYLLEALPITEEKVRSMTLLSIKSWLFGFNRSYKQASQQQKQNIGMLISRYQEMLPATVVKELLFINKIPILYVLCEGQ